MKEKDRVVEFPNGKKFQVIKPEDMSVGTFRQLTKQEQSLDRGQDGATSDADNIALIDGYASVLEQLLVDVTPADIDTLPLYELGKYVQLATRIMMTRPGDEEVVDEGDNGGQKKAKRSRQKNSK